MTHAQKIRGIIFLTSAIIMINIFIIICLAITSSQLQIIRLTQVFALVALSYLYLTLLISPLYTVFPFIPYKVEVITARRALGVSAFFFALIHAGFAFFGQLGGFSGLLFLNNDYLIGITLGALALSILTVLTLTAFDKVIGKLTFPKWKRLHRLVYLAAILILIHALRMGTHFHNLSETIPKLVFLFVTFLLILEAIRFDKYLTKRHFILPKVGLPVLVVILALGYYFSSIFTQSTLSFSLHPQHLQQPSPSLNAAFTTTHYMPGLEGDPTLRYTANFSPPQEPLIVNEDVTLQFTIYNASNGERVKLFSPTYEKFMHLIIVDETLTYFSHIHPELTNDGFRITTTFPKEGNYHLYLNFQPVGAIEQQQAVTLTVGEKPSDGKPTHTPDTDLTKTVGRYTASLTFPTPLLSDELSKGNQKLTFTITETETKKPVTTLKPYLASFGHLVMINQETFDYIHVHPYQLRQPKKNENSGPAVEFLPMSIYKPITPGIYRIFAQFNPNGDLITTDFTVQVK